MELDDLKNSWKKEAELYSQLHRKDFAQLQLILQEKTSGVLHRVSKKYKGIVMMVFIGIVANIIISPFLHWLLGEDGPVFRTPSLLHLSLIILICLAIAYFFWIKFISLQLSVDGDDLRSTLTGNIRTLKRSYRQEIVFIASIFLGLFIAGRAISQLKGNGNFWDIYKPDILLALLAGCLLLCGAILLRRKEYRKNIAELEQYLAEFDESA